MQCKFSLNLTTSDHGLSVITNASNMEYVAIKESDYFSSIIRACADVLIIQVKCQIL